MLSQYQASPQEINIEALYLMFHSLYNNPKNILVMDPSMPNVDEFVFNLNADRKEFNGDMVEKYPHQITDPLGRPVYIGCFIYSDHGGNFVTRR